MVEITMLVERVEQAQSPSQPEPSHPACSFLVTARASHPRNRAHGWHCVAMTEYVILPCISFLVFLKSISEAYVKYTLLLWGMFL